MSVERCEQCASGRALFMRVRHSYNVLYARWAPNKGLKSNGMIAPYSHKDPEKLYIRRSSNYFLCYGIIARIISCGILRTNDAWFQHNPQCGIIFRGLSASPAAKHSRENPGAGNPPAAITLTLLRSGSPSPSSGADVPFRLMMP